MIEQYAPTAGQVATYLAIVLVFLSLIILILVHEKEEKRKRCMMNHPAGSRAKIEPSHSGQTNETSRHLHLGTTFGKLAREIETESSDSRLSSEDFSSRPHHLEGD